MSISAWSIDHTVCVSKTKPAPSGLPKSGLPFEPLKARGSHGRPGLALGQYLSTGPPRPALSQHLSTGLFLQLEQAVLIAGVLASYLSYSFMRFYSLLLSLLHILRVALHLYIREMLVGRTVVEMNVSREGI